MADAQLEMAKAAREMAASPPAFTREAFSEYHLYSLGRRTTLRRERDEADLAARRHRRAGEEAVRRRTASSSTTGTGSIPGSPLKDQVAVFYKLRNDEASGLGMPMPAGTVRVYQADSKGGVQFAGEDRIDHTPKDEDVLAPDRHRLRRRLRAQADRLPEDCRRRVRDGVPDHAAQPQGDADLRAGERADRRRLADADARRITATKTDAWAAQFTVPVAANGEAVLSYRVRVRW